jgi:hypothetical protein
MADSKYFVDVFGDIVSAVRAEYDEANNLEPYYMYGHPREIANRLSLKDKSQVQKFQKYPLIVLLQDFQESHGDTNYNYDYTLPITALIVTKTRPTYTSEERYENTFKPILYPIYELLIEKINISEDIITQSIETIEYTKTDRLFWGAASTYSNEGLIFNDNLDAIELNFTGLQISRDNTCQ